MQEKKNQKKESFRFGKQKAAVTEKTDRRAGHLQAKNEKVGSAKKPGMKKNSESGSATRKRNEIRPGRKEAGKELPVTAVPKKKQIPGQICRVEKKCGGCQLLHLTYEEQLKKKQKQVSILMKPYCTGAQDHRYGSAAALSQ